MPKTRAQIAAMPMRLDKAGVLNVLMVTSRDTGRWLMPKGWIMDGKKPWAAAEIEALEEAGAKGAIGHKAIGAYHYVKRMDGSKNFPCKVTVYPMMVEKLLRDWKERDQRKRKWFTPKSAARKVDEPELIKLLQALPKKPDSLVALMDPKNH